MTVDWFADDWGHGRVHIGISVEDAHDASEAAAEAKR